MSNNFFTLCSLFYIILLSIIYFSKPRFKNLETKIYQYMILSNLVTVILAVVSYFTIMNYYSIPLINDIISKLLLIAFFFWGIFFAMYIVAITFSKNILKQIYRQPFIILFMLYCIAFCILIYFLPLYYHNDNNIIYSYGPAANMTFITSGVDALIYIICLIYSLRRGINKKYIPLVIYVIGGTLVVVLQKMYPELLLVSAMETFVTFVMYFTIENPDVKMIEELNMAKDQADKANRAKTDFLSSMSHEIRTPLNAIVGLSEDIASYEKEVPPQVKEDTDDIINASNTLLEIVGNILDISKIESDKLDIVASPYKVREEIEKLVKVDITRIGNKPIDFKATYAEDLPYELIGDKVHVKEIINNILTNAIKYTDKGHINLNVKCINKDDKCLLIVLVEDTGRGIKKESIEKLFTKFERLDERNSTIEGTGLGLAITKKLLDKMGGKINVNSVFGKGSIFIVQIPQLISKMSKPQGEEEVETNSYREDYTGKRLLVVDDNELNIKVAERALSGLKFTIDTCLSGKECIDKIAKGEKYDAILLDIMMPEMSGETTFKELKKIEGFNIPVVALTADAISGAKEKYIEEGFDGYIAKPFTRDQIKEKLDKIIK